VLFAVVYWQTAGTMKNRIHRVIDSETHSLMRHYRASGITGLKNAINDRLEPGTHHDRYLLVAHGQRIAGDLPQRVAGSGWFQSYRTVNPSNPAYGDRDSPHMPIIARGTRLQNGDILVVAHDAQELVALRSRLFYALLWGLTLTLLLGAAGGALMGRAALRRVENINRVARRIIEGELSRRVLESGRGDEFDHLARHLNRMLDQIERLMNGMRQVSSDIAHDLRTPLGRLRQGLETARLKANSTEDYRHAMDQAMAQTDHILDIFSALLRIAQIESGSRRARFAPFDLSALAESLAETYAVVAEESNHMFSSDIAPGIEVRGDRDLITQALANLIDNAITHTPNGSRIDLSVRNNGNETVVTVADNGSGVPAEALDKVTQRFYRLEASRTTSGSGLGLSMVAAIIELHGSKLKLNDNTPGLAASFDLPHAD